MAKSFVRQVVVFEDHFKKFRRTLERGTLMDFKRNPKKHQPNN